MNVSNGLQWWDALTPVVSCMQTKQEEDNPSFFITDAPRLDGKHAKKNSNSIGWLHFYIKTNATVDTAVAPKTAYPALYAPFRDKTSRTT
jgi:hypothetical protein